MLALDYMRRTRRVTPEIEARAKMVIGVDYQRLLTFEVKGGGFEWFGSPPANVILTGVALQEFSEMNAVYPIDTRIIDRARAWLLSQQRPDGSWTEPNMSHSLTSVGGDLPVTAYALWSLRVTGCEGTELAKAVGYVKGHLSGVKDPYTLSLAAMALLSVDPKDPVGLSLLDQLDATKVESEKRVHWSGSSVVTCASGRAADVETTAMVVLAMEKAGRHPNTVTQALDWIVSAKDANGNWQSTQATILALKALVGASPGSAAQVKGKATVRVNGREVESFDVTPENSDVTRVAEAKPFVKKGANAIEVEWTGEGSLLYQAAGKYFLPWNGARPEKQEPFSIDVTYDRTELEKNDQVLCTVKATNRQASEARMVMLAIGVPPGFSVDNDELGNLVEAKTIAKFDLTSREAILYVDRLAAGQAITLSYRLRARYPVRARSERSRIYEYYDPDKCSEAAPVEFRVK